MEERSIEFLRVSSGGVIYKGNPELFVKGIFTDSRNPLEGGAFLALPGERFDGHDFIESLGRYGCRFFIVSRTEGIHFPEGSTVLLVHDTVQAYGQIAGAYRRQYPKVTVFAVCGSNGKTTTKELLATVLSRKGRTLASRKNFNNHIGVPETLLRISSEDRYVVAEAGSNHPGELRPLLELIAPQYGILTGIAHEHLEFFGSIEGVLAEEGVLLESLPKGGKLFINKDFAEYDRLIARLAPERDVVTVSKNFQSNALLCGRLKKLSFKGTEFVVRMPDGKECVCRIPQPGGHHITNALLAIAVGFNEGISWEQIVEALASAPVPEMRSKISIRRGMLVIEDCYNANQDSMRAALETLAELPPWKKGGKRCAILGTMGEIGVEAVRIHRQIARYASELPIDYLLFCGEFAEEMCEEIRMETSFTGEVKACATIEDLKPYLKTYLEIGDMVLLKASRSQMFERIVPWLEELE